VILADTPRGPTIVGALQTARAVSVEPDGTVALEGKAIRIRADKAISLETGASAVRLEESGRVRAEGHRMVIDMSSNVRVLSALVELP
jgi:N-acetylmuramic acid 6-phosphate (MurNAc-6-P) etherase